MKPVTQATISAVMSALSRRRTPKQRRGGPGRPKSPDRCPCGKYTRSYAARRGYECEEEWDGIPARLWQKF